MRNILFFLLLLFLCFSCFKEDNPMPPYPGETITIENNLGSYQSYFDLESKSVLMYNDTGEWDIGFEASERGWHLKINSAKELFVYNTGVTDITQAIDLPGNEIWKYDASSGNDDSTAFGKWCDTTVFPFTSEGLVYIIGKKKSDVFSEYGRMQFIQSDSDRYLFNYNTQNNKTVRQGEVLKNDSVNYVYFNLAEGIQKNLEPDNMVYDLLFTPYYDLLFDDDGTPVPYFLRGVLLNTNSVKAYKETNVPFEEFTFSDVKNEKFTDRQDVIGYNWKDVDIDFNAGSAVYYVIPGITYIISSAEGNLYKLRFLSYTKNGINGFPQFEVKSLVN